ncbi:MAG: hypothetical protein ACYC2G_14745 [Gemmatimonadaceae bacterium]
MAYGIACWRIYRGGRGLLAVIVIADLANLSLSPAAIPGPDQLLAGRPLAVVGVIALQIVVTLVLVGLFSRRPEAGWEPGVVADRH